MPENIWLQYRDRIAGVWKCVSFELYDDSGKLLAKPHGDEPLGRVSISPGGYMSAHVSNPGRRPLPSGKAWPEGGDAEVAQIARASGGYCGPLELFNDAQTGLWLQTMVEISLDPSRIGKYEKRRVEFVEEGGRELMVLRPFGHLPVMGLKANGVLKWEKLE
ncbi:hypothetical protein BAUCODRAFT_320396 [Baudoinia panamericana UAMH 10762]|uniref:Lipocalin-like domain-containing protein n=1 Tax=Baudoinia panamericana (strain UAMH 10762) TaxID=717646 RepID=M2MY94_BAUPA|nr:uncharacterized protein BAUCODRAFT_320396 [Baudoinia panamericana UAMH 10762]EMC91260.1 hypothetical protein BAUCODRAFT_320396 [Baudoinia panamericana UAMH 10762]